MSIRLCNFDEGSFPDIVQRAAYYSRLAKTGLNSYIRLISQE